MLNEEKRSEHAREERTFVQFESKERREEKRDVFCRQKYYALALLFFIARE